VLSVVVRSGPILTAVNGTLVAWPVRLTWGRAVPLVLTSTAGRGSPLVATASLASRERGAAGPRPDRLSRNGWDFRALFRYGTQRPPCRPAEAAVAYRPDATGALDAGG
jgi:hypothetical protein